MPCSTLPTRPSPHKRSPPPSRCASSATSARASGCSSCPESRSTTWSPPTRSRGRLRRRATSGAPDERILHATFLFGSSDGEADFGETSQAAYSAVYEAAFRSLDLPADEGEEAAFVGIPPLAVPVVYLKLPHGYGRTKLNNAWFERKLGTAATTRNWRTVQALAELARGA